MKVRLADNSIRIRLSQSEVAALADSRPIEEKLEFAGGQTLEYSIGTGAELGASFDGRRIAIVLPEGQVRGWAAGSEVGIAGSSGALKVLIEKDFQCLHGPEAGNADAFPNPAAKSHRHG